jgi:ABC-type nitrate/sulfonate/bicarbonate transport system permease component
MKQSAKQKSRRPIPGLLELRTKLLTVIVLVVSWELLSRLNFISPLSLPRPTILLATLRDLIVVGYPKGMTVWVHIGATVWRIIQGYILAVVIAIPLGIFIGGNELLNRATGPVVTFSRSIATISLLPLAIAWFGVGEVTRVLLICYGCFWPILTNTIQGIRQVDPDMINAARMLGTTRQQLFFRVMLPAALPIIFAGMKIGLGIGFMVIIGVEMIGTIKGLGALIQQARFFYSTDIAINGMIFIAILGLLISIVLDWLERILLPWSQGLQEVER